MAARYDSGGHPGGRKQLMNVNEVLRKESCFLVDLQNEAVKTFPKDKGFEKRPCFGSHSSAVVMYREVYEVDTWMCITRYSNISREGVEWGKGHRLFRLFGDLSYRSTFGHNNLSPPNQFPDPYQVKENLVKRCFAHDLFNNLNSYSAPIGRTEQG